MRDFSDKVGPARSRDRFPFDQMTQIGDMFHAREVGHRSLAATVSATVGGTQGRRFATFAAASGGTRVFLVDIVGQPQSEA